MFSQIISPVVDGIIGDDTVGSGGRLPFDGDRCIKNARKSHGRYFPGQIFVGDEPVDDRLDAISGRSEAKDGDVVFGVHLQSRNETVVITDGVFGVWYDLDLPLRLVCGCVASRGTNLYVSSVVVQSNLVTLVETAGRRKDYMNYY